MVTKYNPSLRIKTNVGDLYFDLPVKDEKPTQFLITIQMLDGSVVFDERWLQIEVENKNNRINLR